MRLVYFGSGAFGLPTLEQLADQHDVALIVTQPDRPAGRSRQPVPTPIGAFAEEHSIPVIKPELLKDPAVTEQIRSQNADAFVVIAYGRKLGPALLKGMFAINLHGSLLPKYRGAAPINWAMIEGETETGVSVITLAQTMDAGEVLAQRSLTIGPSETAGELHDRMALLGPEVFLDVLNRFASNTLESIRQDESQVTQAPKMLKDDGSVDFDAPAPAVKCRINGLNPWPSCTVKLGDLTLRVLKAEIVEEPVGGRPEPGEIIEGGIVACSSGAVRLLEVQPAGKKPMSFDAFLRGRTIESGARFTSM